MAFESSCGCGAGGSKEAEEGGTGGRRSFRLEKKRNRGVSGEKVGFGWEKAGNCRPRPFLAIKEHRCERRGSNGAKPESGTLRLEKKEGKRGKRGKKARSEARR